MHFDTTYIPTLRHLGTSNMQKDLPNRPYVGNVHSEGDIDSKMVILWRIYWLVKYIGEQKQNKRNKNKNINIICTARSITKGRNDLEKVGQSIHKTIQGRCIDPHSLNIPDRGFPVLRVCTLFVYRGIWSSGICPVSSSFKSSIISSTLYSLLL